MDSPVQIKPFERFAGFSLTQTTVAWGGLRIIPCFLLGCALFWLGGAARRIAAKPSLAPCFAASAPLRLPNLGRLT